MEANDKPLWVGKRSSKVGGGVYVYDVELEGGKSDSIYLFDTYRDSMQQFGREGLREAFETIKDLNLKETALRQYAKWLLSSGEKFVRIHQINITPEKLKEHAQNLSKQHWGSNSCKVYGSQRSAKCYSCHNGINSQSGIECEKCHWIICNHCGACGCSIRTRVL